MLGEILPVGYLDDGRRPGGGGVTRSGKFDAPEFETDLTELWQIVH